MSLSRAGNVASQVYMHHFVGATTFLVEAGAELRGRQQRAPVSILSTNSCIHLTVDLWLCRQERRVPSCIMSGDALQVFACMKCI